MRKEFIRKITVMLKSGTEQAIDKNESVGLIRYN